MFMKTKISHWYNALAATLLSLLGFSSCGENGLGGEPCLYGSPTSDYLFKGNVTDQADQPIEGIKAVMCLDEGEDYPDYRLDSTYTDAKGNYETKKIDFKLGGSPDGYLKEGKLKIVLEDVDGQAHGGKFATDTIDSKDMSVEQTQKGDGWYQGAYTITAKKKQLKLSSSEPTTDKE